MAAMTHEQDPNKRIDHPSMPGILADRAADEARAEAAFGCRAPRTTEGDGWTVSDHWDYRADGSAVHLWSIDGPAPFGGVRLTSEERVQAMVECLNAMTGRVPPAPKPAPPREPNDADRTAETLAQAIEDFAASGLTVTVSGSELRLSPGPPPVCVPEVESCPAYTEGRTVPTDDDLSQRVAELLQADNEAVLAGYTGVIDRLAFAELHVPAAQAVLCYCAEMGISMDVDDRFIRRLNESLGNTGTKGES